MEDSEQFNGRIAVGQHVHCILYGGKDGVVTEIHGDQAPGSCRALGGGVGVTGGNAHFDIVWDNGTQSRGIPESLIRCSVQWHLYPEVAATAEVAAAIAHLAIEEARRKTEADQAAIAFANRCSELVAKHPELKLSSSEPDGFKRAVTNMRVSLKKSFPKVKFSVRQQYYGSVDVRWTDGPTSSQVQKIIGRFQEGHFDGMEDIYRNEHKPWTEMFGGAKYVSTYRDVSDAILQIGLDRLYEQLAGNLQGVQKPDVKDLQGFGSSPQIPDLNMTVNEGVRGIAEVYDATTGQFSYDGYFRYNWLVDPLIEAQKAEAAEAVA